MSNDSIKKTLIVALSLCVVCSVLVSGAAVSLKSKQEENKALDIKKNLLLAAGLLENKGASKEEILDVFSRVETKVVDLDTGEYVDVDPATVDMVKDAKNPETSKKIRKDIAGIKTRSKLGKVYLVKDGGSLSMIVLPIYGKGLWSTMYGFLALAPDANTVKGIGFYAHGETPGLGGEIENPKWQASWIGKKIYADKEKPVLDVVKGAATKNYQIDGLSGATITSNGVETMIRYWFGHEAYQKFLQRLVDNKVSMNVTGMNK